MELEKNVSNLEKSNAEPNKPNHLEKKIFERLILLCSILVFLQVVSYDIEKILVRIGEILRVIRQLFGP